MSQKVDSRLSDGKVVFIALLGGMVAFGLALVYISGGGVRQTQIFMPEKAQVTVAFQKIDGETRLVGIGGIAGVDPTIIMRTGDFTMEMTIINQDSVTHGLYIDGLNTFSGYMIPGESKIMTLHSKGEAIYNYYDYGKQDEPLGQIKAVKVTMYD